MKYTDVHVGQKVLVNYKRTSNPNYHVANSEMAEVLAVGVPHRFKVTSGGWGRERSEYKETDQGVRLRVTREDTLDYRGEDTLEPEYEMVTLAAKMVPAEGDALARWEKARAQKDAARDKRAADKARWAAQKARLTAVGLEAEWDSWGVVSFQDDQVEALLARLEAQA